MATRGLTRLGRESTRARRALPVAPPAPRQSCALQSQIESAGGSLTPRSSGAGRPRLTPRQCAAAAEWLAGASPKTWRAHRRSRRHPWSGAPVGAFLRARPQRLAPASGGLQSQGVRRARKACLTWKGTPRSGRHQESPAGPASRAPAAASPAWRALRRRRPLLRADPWQSRAARAPRAALGRAGLQGHAGSQGRRQRPGWLRLRGAGGRRCAGREGWAAAPLSGPPQRAGLALPGGRRSLAAGGLSAPTLKADRSA